MNNIANLMDDVPLHPPDLRVAEEIIQTLLSKAGVRIERIVSYGHASPMDFWYDQDHPEWVMVLKGAAILRFQDAEGPVAMKPGDCVNIQAHRRHRVEWTTPDEPTIWLAVHYSDE